MLVMWINMPRTKSLITLALNLASLGNPLLCHLIPSYSPTCNCLSLLAPPSQCVLLQNWPNGPGVLSCYIEGFWPPCTRIHPKLRNINLHNVTHSLISRNPGKRMFVVQISLLIVTFLSLISWILSLMQTTQEVNPHPRIASCVNMWSVTFLFLFFFFFFLLFWCHLLKRRHKTAHCIMEYHDQCMVNRLAFTPVQRYGRYFFFSFSCHLLNVDATSPGGQVEWTTPYH